MNVYKLSYLKGIKEMQIPNIYVCFKFAKVSFLFNLINFPYYVTECGHKRATGDGCFFTVGSLDL